MPEEQAKPAPQGKIHTEIPDTEGETCVICHEGLDKGTTVHAPVAARECTTCHEFAGKGEATTVNLAAGATSDNASPLCTICHDEAGSAAAGPGGHAPAAAGDCVSCHQPHVSDQPRLLKMPQKELCTLCHDDVGGQLTLETVHKPAAAACGLCHDPHGSEKPARVRADINDLCLACHLLQRETSKEGPQNAALLGRAVAAAEAPLLSPDARVLLDRTRTLGHPVDRHPVSGPKNPLDENQPLTCVSCHGPHGTKGRKLIRFAAEGEMMVCVECHK